MSAGIRLEPRLRQSVTLGQQQQLGLQLLARSLPELRAEVIREIEGNPVIEDTDNPLERAMSDVERERVAAEPEEDGRPEDDFVALSRRYDEEAVERRQALFENRVREETLREHLSAQLPLSDIPPRDQPLAEALIGDFDDNGYYRGATADLCMVYECTEERVSELLREISGFDPPGCGARNLRECLAAQLDKVPAGKLREKVRYLLDHLEELAAGGFAGAEYAEAVKALRRLDPHPGRAFASERDRVEYVNPEVHAYVDDDGRWCADTDARSLPAIRISPRFEAMLKDPGQSEETKAYIRERIERARAVQKAIRDRQETIENIAQAIFDRQQDFFSQGLRGLKPLTELEIAAAVGVSGTTVSRTVRDKYASTPQGTIELRRFFSSGVKTGDGGMVAQETVLGKLRELVAAEDPASPLSDERLAAALKAAGYPVARRTVAKYRDRLGIPGTSERRRAAGIVL